MTTRAKPDFSVGGGGMVDPEFIPADVRRELLLHLEKSPLTGEQKNAQTAQTELKQSLTELKNSLIQWLEEIDRIYQQRLDEMKKTL